MANFYKTLPDTEYGLQRVAICSPSGTTEDSGIRLYCDMAAVSWNLQIRGFFQTANMDKGKKWYYANANLKRGDLVSLRDACSAALAEYPE